MSDTPLFIITGPSGAGKTTITQELLLRNLQLCKVVTHTSRQPRAGEVNGVDYHFVSETEFIDLARFGRLYEYARVYGNLYGTSKAAVKEVQAKGYVPLLVTDVQGATCWHNHCHLSPTVVLVLPPSETELARRLRTRGDDDPDIHLRLDQAAEEVVSCVPLAGYIALNEDLQVTVADINNFINDTLRKL